jgi:hypothetical protein
VIHTDTVTGRGNFITTNKWLLTFIEKALQTQSIILRPSKLRVSYVTSFGHYASLFCLFLLQFYPQTAWNHFNKKVQ